MQSSTYLDWDLLDRAKTVNRPLDSSRVVLLHWNMEEGTERVHRLREGGFEAGRVPLEIPVAFKQLRENPPSAVVIDLSRLPSGGRDVAMSLRTYKATRHVPIVFVDGDPEKVAQIKEFLPDARYTSWDDIRNSLRRAIAHPPSDPVVPKSRLEGYSGASLPKKLGIRKGSVVSLIDAPSGFEKALGKSPDDVAVPQQTIPWCQCDHLVRPFSQWPGSPHQTDGTPCQQGRTLDRLAQERLRAKRRSIAGRRAKGRSSRGNC